MGMINLKTLGWRQWWISPHRSQYLMVKGWPALDYRWRATSWTLFFEWETVTWTQDSYMSHCCARDIFRSREVNYLFFAYRLRSRNKCKLVMIGKKSKQHLPPLDGEFIVLNPLERAQHHKEKKIPLKCKKLAIIWGTKTAARDVDIGMFPLPVRSLKFLVGNLPDFICHGNWEGDIPM